MNPREELEAARELIRDPKDWACSAQTTRPGGPFCAHYALGRVLGDQVSAIETSAFQALRRVIIRLGGSGYVGGFNDNHTHAEVLELFNLAIADEIAKEDAAASKARVTTEPDTRHMTEEQEREQAEDPAAPLVFA